MELKLKNKQNFLNYIIFIFIIISFFLGYLLNENSGGAGQYFGDIESIWKNQNIFFNYNLIEAITHKDYFDSRTPISYILHKWLNPFAKDLESYRNSVFIISTSLPLIFYFYLKKKYHYNLSNIFLITSVLILSPYYRTTSFWALEENYGLILLVVNSYLILEYKKFNKYLILTLICLISSLTFYFDQKLIIIPIITLYFIIKNFDLQKIIFCVLFFFLLSLPYIYLMWLWQAPVPTSTETRAFALNIENIGYALTIIFLYIIPFIFFEVKNFLKNFKIFILKKNNLFLLFLILIYSVIFYLNFENFYQRNDSGNGVFFKLINLIFDEIVLKKIIFSIIIIFSTICIIYFFQSTFDRLIILYFVLLGLIVTPLYQEYYDPVIFIMLFTYFKKKINIDYKKSIILILYFSIFLIGSITYYKIVI